MQLVAKKAAPTETTKIIELDADMNAASTKSTPTLSEALAEAAIAACSLQLHTKAAASFEPACDKSGHYVKPWCVDCTDAATLSKALAEAAVAACSPRLASQEYEAA